MGGLIVAYLLRAVPYLVRLFWAALVIAVLTWLASGVWHRAASGALDWEAASIMLAALSVLAATSIVVSAASIRAYRKSVPPTPHL
ncbi:hypothetical protein [Glycomyces sp. NPDC047010]|uniref:hypothetical protein n=1 Tax=Glycomyces sp. NPDC047010 TaxID=3155023 RepID=UPI0034047070